MARKAKVEQVVASGVEQAGDDFNTALNEIAVPSKSVVKRKAIQKKKKSGKTVAKKKVVKKGAKKKAKSKKK